MMRITLLYISFFIVTACIGQQVSDTTELYNGRLVKKRILLNDAGIPSKEIYYYPNGAIQTEYFLAGGEKVRWVAYDEQGNITASWEDPDLEHATHRKIRNTVLLVTLLIVSGVVLFFTRVHYRFTYVSILFLTIIFPVVALVWIRSLAEGVKEPVTALISSLLFIFPSILSTLSIINLTKRKDIPIIVSVVGLLIGLGWLLFFSMVLNIAGAGMPG